MDHMPGIWARWTRGGRRVVARPDWIAAAGADFADRVMTIPATDRVHSKQGRSTGRLAFGGRGKSVTVYLKRHYQLPWWTRLLALLFPRAEWSPGMFEYRQLQWAKRQGIRVPEPVAAGEFVGPGLRLQSFLAVEELTDMVPLHEALPIAQRNLTKHAFEAWKRAIVIEMARMTRILHRANRYHKDLYLCHFFVARADIRKCPSFHGRLYLIDFQRLSRHTWLGWHYRVKDLGGLLFSADWPGVSARDRLRFLHHYLGGRIDGRGRRLLAAAMWKAGRYRRHNDKHPRLMPDRTDRREALAS